MANQHPSESDLHKFANGELDDDRFEEVAAHLEHCDECSDVLRKTGAFKSPIAASTETPKAKHGRQSTGVEHATDKPVEVAQTEDIRSSKYGIVESTGSRVGPYKLLQELGHGGMGVVYMAEQEKPVRRMVALKIIKPGMDSQQVIARFEAERQALAMMDHHNIAKVLDAGTTDTGRPYFAMELVKGVPITDYCDANKLTPRERLEMFIPVCQAIQHAHQKGIIHRDVKPSNVLVTLYDGKPVPKVIDFGIAKATQQKLTERTMFTGIGQILGTLEYMSPEQAEMNQLDIDTRSDVYSLGVMLYELLTGSTPITKEKLRDVGLEEMLRTIRETEPPKPSTRLSDSADALPSISAVRKTEPAKLSKLVRGDLDWIVMKALEKDRTRRYETANGLAADVLRFLSDEAVEACPPSTGYRFRKFARRNKTALATGVTVTGILIAATILSSTLAVWAWRAEKIATLREREATASALAEQRAREDEQEQRKMAEENAAKATREATKSREVATFLKDMLKGVGPSVALGRDTKMLEEILDTTGKRISELKHQPEVEADIRSVLADVYGELGRYDEVLEMRRRIFDLWNNLGGLGNKQTVGAMRGMAGAMWVEGKTIPEGRTMLNEVLAIQESRFPDDQAEIATTRVFIANSLQAEGDYQGAENELEKALAIRSTIFGADSDEAFDLKDSMASLNYSRRRYKKAEMIWREILKRNMAKSEISPEVSTGKNNVAIALLGQGQYVEATELMRSALSIDRKLYDSPSIHIATPLNNLAAILADQGEYAEAANLYRESLQQKRELHMEETTLFASSLGNLGMLHMNQNNYSEALELIQNAYDIYQSRGSYPDAWVSTLVDVLCKLHRYDEAMAILNKAVNDGDIKAFEHIAMDLIWQEKFDEQSHRYEAFLNQANATNASAMRRLARCILLNPKAPRHLVDRAAELANQSVELESGRALAVNSSRVAMGLAEYRQSNYESASELFRQAQEPIRGESYDQQSVSTCFLAMSTFKAGNIDKAEDLLQLAEQRLGIRGYIEIESALNDVIGVKGNIALREARRLIRGREHEITSLSDAERLEKSLQHEQSAAHNLPEDTDQTRSLAWWYLWFDRKSEYRDICEGILSFAENQTEPSEDSYYACERAATAIVWSSIHERNVIEQARKLAARAIELANTDNWRSWATFLLGAAEFRLGNLEKAEKTLADVRVDGHTGTLIPERLLVLAMIRHDLGMHAEARANLEKAKTLFPLKPSRDEPSIELFGRFYHAPAIWLLYEEALGRLGIDDADVDDHSESREHQSKSDDLQSSNAFDSRAPWSPLGC